MMINVRPRPALVLCALVIGLYLAGSMMGQLSQSGGVALAGALPAGTNVIGKLGIDQTTPGTTNGVQINAALPAGANVIGHVITDSGTITAVTAITNALPAGANVIGSVTTIPKTACGTTVASQALAAVPTSSAAVFSSTTCVEVIVLNNTNSSAGTVTVTDNQGTPINDVLTFNLPANSQLVQPLHGVAFTTGVKWTASGTGFTGAILGYQ